MSPQLQRLFQAWRIPVKPAAPTVPKAQNPSEPPGEVGFVRGVSVGSSKLPKEWIRNSWECLGSARARPSSRPGVTSQKCRWKTGQATGRTGRAWIPPSPVSGRGELLPPSCPGGFIQVYPGFHGIRRDSAFLRTAAINLLPNERLGFESRSVESLNFGRSGLKMKRIPAGDLGGKIPENGVKTSRGIGGKHLKELGENIPRNGIKTSQGKGK